MVHLRGETKKRKAYRSESRHHTSVWEAGALDTYDPNWGHGRHRADDGRDGAELTSLGGGEQAEGRCI